MDKPMLAAIQNTIALVTAIKALNKIDAHMDEAAVSIDRLTDMANENLVGMLG